MNGEQTTAKNIYAIGDVLHNPKVGTAALPCLASPRLALPRLASPRLALPRLALPCLALLCFALAAVAMTARSALNYAACTASVLE